MSTPCWEGKNVYERMVEVRKIIGHMTKDGTNPHHHYDYTSAPALSAALRPLLNEWNLVLTQEGVTHLGTQHNGKMFLSEIRVEYVLRCADKPDDRVVLVAAGGGADPLDKGLFKAQTGAYKYALFDSLQISGEKDAKEDAERDRFSEEAEEINSRAGQGPTQEVGARIVPPAEKPPARPACARQGQRRPRPSRLRSHQRDPQEQRSVGLRANEAAQERRHKVYVPLRGAGRRPTDAHRNEKL